jgi:transcriptional regulator with XRE-family HTH domain
MGYRISLMTAVEIPPAKQKGDLLSAIGETLRAERTERGLTLKQVAEGAHVSVSYLAEIERGEKDPSSKVLESIARGLDVELSELLVRIASALEPAPVVPVANSLAA